MESIQRDSEEKRRAILTILNEVDGRPIRAKRVRVIASENGNAMLWRNFVSHLRYLSDLQLLIVFQAGRREPLSPVDRKEYLDLVSQMQFDDPECDAVLVRIRKLGVQFLEGNAAGIVGVARN